MIALQIATFFYYYIMGICLTNEINILNWSDKARLVYVFFSVITAFISCLFYLLNDSINERK